MSENKQYFIPVYGRLVTVTEIVYREYYKMGRRERYLEESDIAHGRVLYSDMDTDEMLGEETIPDMNATSVEQIVVDGIMVEKLRQCLDLLTDAERKLVDALFFNCMTEREYSLVSGIPQKTINDRKSRILGKLKQLMEK